MSRFRYFSMSEFSCNCCGMGKKLISKTLIMKLDNMRHELGKPIRISSGVRCIEHNRNVGGTLDSSHLCGLAVDILVPDSRYRFELLELAQKYGINRIGVYRSFVHLDIDPAKEDKVIWYGAGRLRN